MVATHWKQSLHPLLDPNPPVEKNLSRGQTKAHHLAFSPTWCRAAFFCSVLGMFPLLLYCSSWNYSGIPSQKWKKGRCSMCTNTCLSDPCPICFNEPSYSSVKLSWGTVCGQSIALLMHRDSKNILTFGLSYTQWAARVKDKMVFNGLLLHCCAPHAPSWIKCITAAVVLQSVLAFYHLPHALARFIRPIQSLLPRCLRHSLVALWIHKWTTLLGLSCLGMAWVDKCKCILKDIR